MWKVDLFEKGIRRNVYFYSDDEIMPRGSGALARARDASAVPFCLHESAIIV